jgi:hypothetical protein
MRSMVTTFASGPVASNSRRESGTAATRPVYGQPGRADTLHVVPSVTDVIGYMRTVGRGSPVDRPWSIPGQMLTTLRLGRGQAPVGSPLTLQDILASDDYRDLMTANLVEGDVAPDFDLPPLDGTGSVRLGALVEGGPVALVFGSYT